MERKVIKEVIVVEGPSDTAKLKSLVDCDTIETRGLALNEETLALITQTAQHRGILIFTDPDHPGQKIRQWILDRVPECKQAFVAKKDAIGHHKVGVAEARSEAILEALERAATFNKTRETLSWQAFLQFDVIGNRQRRLYLYDYFHLGYGNVKTLFKRLNMTGIDAAQIQQALSEEQR